jgi:3-dehydroquinate synthase
MAVSHVPEPLVVQSHRGPYRVDFAGGALAAVAATDPAATHVIVDDRVAELYATDLGPVLERPSTLRIVASEDAKSLERFPGYVEHLVAHGVRRAHVLVAVGGGVLQDIVCFLAATLLRGLEWHFVPTTLLAQADSCIGSKSSINVGAAKNVLGTFTPPERIAVDTAVLATLAEHDVRSGIGEMLKVHAIDGPESFDRIAADYDRLQSDHALMTEYIRRSLAIKQRIIELDEFDRGPRNVMNYGHSFGHAIESATRYAIPHGIAVTIGMDMANHVAARLGFTGEDVVARMRPTLRANSRGFEDVPIPLGAFLAAIAKDKKNTATQLRLVLPDRDGRLSVVPQAADETFRAASAEYLERGRA